MKREKIKETIPQSAYRLNAYSGKYPTLKKSKPIERPTLKLISRRKFVKPNIDDYRFGTLNFYPFV